jgi:antitoxin component YwqK of YwqJK toxin-antitoxin module
MVVVSKDTIETVLNGDVEKYWDNGQLRGKGNFKDGNPDGVIEEYLENGQLKEKTTYKDGEEVN